MKKYLHIALMLLCVLAVSSCKDDDNGTDEVEIWKVANEAAFQAKANDPSFTKLDALNNEGFIFYKELKKGDGGSVYYTDTVSVYYKGCILMDSKGNMLTDFSNVLEDGYAFNENMFDNGTPVNFAVSSVVAGWQTALQYMKVGDRWEIWIPQQLGYGSSSQSTIPAYSTLVFDVEVLSIPNRDE